MNDGTPADLIRGLRDRAGIRALLRALGFATPLEAVRVPAIPAVRTVLRSRRDTVCVWVIQLRRDLHTATIRDVARVLRAVDPVGHHVLLLREPHGRRVAIACDAMGGVPRHVVLDPAHVRASDVDLLQDLLPAAGEDDTALALRIARALERSRITDRFFRDVVALRDLVSRAWCGVPRRAVAERDALALLFLSRLMFLYFLQRRGVLDANPRFLPRLLQLWRSRPHATSFFRARLRALFFGVLNRRPGRRSARARSLGTLPYLNGGLFEPHRLELQHRELDLPDVIVGHVFDGLLEKYRFTAIDAAEGDTGDALAVDPEMLGRIFEGLMPRERRGRTGTFYTPPAVVDRVVGTALAAHLAQRCGLVEGDVARFVAGDEDALPEAAATTLRECAASLRVLDPACGSGAFLLGALSRLAPLLAASDATEARRRVVGTSLHGVDLLEDAALICSLRLWLALVPHCNDPARVPPLPNLDRRIRQGDALVDPFDIGDALSGRPLDTNTPTMLRPLTAELAPTAAAYLDAGPETKPALRRRLRRLEAAVARAWLASLQGGLDWRARELAARAADRDLFGEPATHAASAGRQLRTVEQQRQQLAAFRQDVHGARRLPFFSFRVHFADADGFDLVLSNPPWVRAHNWPPSVRSLLRERYHVCRAAGWPYAARLTQLPGGAGAQVDLSLLFLERSLRLLAPQGTLAMLLPAKLFRSLYAGGARELLLQHAALAQVEDQSLDHRAVFEADAFTALVVAHRDDAETAASAQPSQATVAVTLTRSRGAALHFDVPAADLPLRRGDPRSPWLLAPPECAAALRTMQQAGAPLGEQVVIRRGVMTGANEILVVRDVLPRLGDLARIRTEGWYRAQSSQTRSAYAAYVEGSVLRPVLRGTDIGAWQLRTERHVLWTPHNDDAALAAPPRLRRFLLRHRQRLGTDGQAIGALHRLSPHTLGHKVAWSDLAVDLRAAAVKPLLRGVMGACVPVVPLNTVYFAATASYRESLLLAAYMNSLPVRTFARTIAERAKDAHYRFFAWTMAVLPLPLDWRDGPCAGRLAHLAAHAHEAGALDPTQTRELDLLIARSYGLDASQLEALHHFDEWLRGC